METLSLAASVLSMWWTALTSFSPAEWLWLLAFGAVPAVLGFGAPFVRRRPPELVSRTEADAATRRAER